MAVATTDGKAYYYLTHLLKTARITFTSITPGQAAPLGVKLILTTRKEKTYFSDIKTICQEEIGPTPLAAKEKIVSKLYGDKDQTLFIGVDPGERIGWAVYYHQELAGGVVNSVGKLVEILALFTKDSSAGNKIIRIGDGNPSLALEIATKLFSKLKGQTQIEIVDERGTSSHKHAPRRRGLRDQLSAKLISMRPGQIYTPVSRNKPRQRP
ncbi:MAG: hypothetical protein HYU39_06475 [Thaumarchaeota archaeon]|nr:hypothetical protein [Nitrososphaerota archaeon]